jgi:hypothetical protein
MKTKIPLDMQPLEFIKWLNARKFWTGRRYRSACGQYISNFLEKKRESVSLHVGIKSENSVTETKP